jgi:hypothetical protein
MGSVLRALREFAELLLSYSCFLSSSFLLFFLRCRDRIRREEGGSASPILPFGHDASWHQCSVDHGGANRCACRDWACFVNKRTSHFDELTSTIASPSTTTARTSVSVTSVINNSILIDHLLNLVYHWTIGHGVQKLLGWILLRRCSLHSLGKLPFPFTFVFTKKHHLISLISFLSSAWVSWIQFIWD